MHEFRLEGTQWPGPKAVSPVKVINPFVHISAVSLVWSIIRSLITIIQPWEQVKLDLITNLVDDLYSPYLQLVNIMDVIKWQAVFI